MAARCDSRGTECAEPGQHERGEFTCCDESSRDLKAASNER